MGNSMKKNFTTIIENQYEAAFSTINLCLKKCSDEKWLRTVANMSFSQAAFHTLFFADLYLNEFHDDSFRQQEFHQQNKDKFGNYEELKDKLREQQYEKPFVESYLQHCRDKLRSEFTKASEEWFLEPSPFSWIESTRSEVHIYNIRHIQHHAAQLILSLRLEGPIEFPWFRSGWEDLPG